MQVVLLPRFPAGKRTPRLTTVQRQSDSDQRRSPSFIDLQAACQAQHRSQRASMAAPCQAGSICEPWRTARSAMQPDPLQSASHPSCQAGQSARGSCMASTVHARGREDTAPRDRAFHVRRSTIGTDVHVLERRGWTSPVTHHRAPAGRARPMVTGQSLAKRMSQTLRLNRLWVGRLHSP